MNRRERQVQDRRNVILSAALQLFESKGYLETSMEEIAETADVARGTLYNHFESKADVLIALTDSVAGEWLAKGHEELARSGSATSAIREVLSTCASWFDKHPASAKSFFYAMREQITKQNAAIQPRNLTPLEFVIKAQQEGELTLELEAPLLVLMIDSVIKHHLTLLLMNSESQPFAELAKRDLDVVLKRLGPN